MNQQAPGIVKPALISGAIFGVIASIPVINWINCLCCALIIASGFLAAFFQSKAQEPLGIPFGGGDGAKVGLLSGVFYAIVASIIGGIITMIFGGAQFAMLADQLSQVEGMPPEVLEALANQGAAGIGVIFIGLIINLVLGLIFATIGGLIGGSVFKVEPPVTGSPAGGAAPPPSAPPTPPQGA